MVESVSDLLCRRLRFCSQDCLNTLDILPKIMDKMIEKKNWDKERVKLVR